MIPIYLCEDNTLQLDLLKSMIEKYIFIQAYDMEIRQAVHTPHELLDLLPDQPENAVYFLDSICTLTWMESNLPQQSARRIRAHSLFLLRRIPKWQ